MQRLVLYIYRVLTWLLARLPVEAVFTLGAFLGRAIYPFAGSYRELALRNLRYAFGREKSEKELRAIAREHFRLLGANTLSAFRLKQMRVPEVDALIEIVNPEEMQKVTTRPAGTVFVCGHRGCIELFAQTPTLFAPKQPGFFYQRISNPYMEEEIRATRTANGHRAFDRATDLQATNHFLRGGGLVGIQTDQHAGDSGEWVPFFDKLCSTSPLTGIMAKGCKASVVYAVLDTVGTARWRVRYEEICAPGEMTVDEVNTRTPQLLEAAIRERPAEWFWVHNRWKIPSPNFLLQNYRRGVRLPPGMSVEQLQPFRKLVRSPNWLGDIVMALPAIRAFKEGRPDAQVTVLAPAKLAEIWKCAPFVDAVIELPAKASVFQVAKLIRAAGYFEVAIILPNSLRTALEPWLAKIPRRYGYPGHHRERLLDQVPAVPKKITGPPPHHADRYLDLAIQAGAQVEGSAVAQTGLLRLPAEFADLPAPEPRQVQSLPEGSTDFPAGTRRIGLVCGAEYGPAKRWFPERFATAANQVSAAVPEAAWVLFGVEKDVPNADEVLASLDESTRALDLIGRTTLAQLMRELTRCELVLTNDTGTMHLAAALGVPVVAIFGSTEPALTGPMGTGHRILRRHVPCSPCFLRECPFNLECMQEITPEMASAAVLEVLAERASVGRAA